MAPAGASLPAGGAAEAAWAEAVLSGEGALTPAQALEVLQLPPGAAGDGEAARAAYRRLSVRWHPDKNAGQEQRAQAVFVRVAAAYNTLTTANFDYKRWSESYVVPSMQTLEDVLLLAMKGADPFVVDAMLRKRGDYRPHQQFGVDLAVPWSAGTQEVPSWDIVGAQHSTTRALPPAGGGVDALALALRCVEVAGDDAALAADPSRLAGASAARPWERVGGTGFGKPQRGGDVEDDAAPPSALRPELEAGAAGAAAAADAANDAGLAELSLGRARSASQCFAEAFRLRPDAAAYAANEAAAQLARGRNAAAAAAARAALALEPEHARAAQRLGQAALALGEADADAGRDDRGRAALREARAAFALALRLQPGAPAAARGAKQAALAWAAEFDSDEE